MNRKHSLTSHPPPRRPDVAKPLRHGFVDRSLTWLEKADLQLSKDRTLYVIPMVSGGWVIKREGHRLGRYTWKTEALFVARELALIDGVDLIEDCIADTSVEE